MVMIGALFLILLLSYTLICVCYITQSIRINIYANLISLLALIVCFDWRAKGMPIHNAGKKEADLERSTSVHPASGLLHCPYERRLCSKFEVI